MATNIAAISFVSKNIKKKQHTVLSGMLYTSGRTAAYVILGLLISLGIGSTGYISRFLQTYMNEILGPLMIVIGMILTGITSSSARINLVSDSIQSKAEKNGLFYAFPLGFLFAMSFCPVSAGLFFGSMIPLAIEQNSKLIIPFVYGIGTSIPVIVFAFIISFATQYLSSSCKA
jgi:sulfite exporter TauE/SafE